MTDRILRRPEVETLVGVKRGTLYDWMAQGAFPRPVALGARLVGWRQSEVTAWLDARAPRDGRAA